VAKQIQAMAQRPETLATAAHAAWNCGRPKAASDLADLVESFGASELMDVIRVGGNNARAASQGERVAQPSTKDTAQ
jgi:UDP-N-acetylglucosamine--N-acetylmuramyl-(pentapeptide) pyrophosphoryl-undecaprenol N-acetylglucosamine transferase